MRSILHIAPLVDSITSTPPGGAEQLTVSLAKFQKSRGYDVKVIAAQGSSMDGCDFLDLGIPPKMLVPIDTSMSLRVNDFSDRRVAGILSKEEMVFTPVKRYILENLDNIGLIHNHAYDFFPLFELNDIPIPILHTLHLGPIIPWINDRLKLNKTFPRWVKYVTCSQSAAGQYVRTASINPAVVYNGLDMSKIPFNSKPEDHFIWVGRISKEKGLHNAIQAVVKDRREKLVVIGRIYDEEYFEKHVSQELNDPLIDYRGPLSNEEVLVELGKAKALVMPIEWDEPFGLIFVEALAAGTPVVSFSRGAVPEIVEHGINGYIANDMGHLSRIIDRVHEISRKVCRKSVESKFSIESMISGYQAEYQELIKIALE